MRIIRLSNFIRTMDDPIQPGTSGQFTPPARVEIVYLSGVPFARSQIPFRDCPEAGPSRARSSILLYDSIRRLAVLCFVLVCGAALGAPDSFLKSYKGTPYRDTRYNGDAQKIPGKVLCAYYDLGGEGVAYHDTDVKNNGSGALNPADGTYLNEFRMHESIDVSYTKFKRDPAIDDSQYDKVTPPADLLYVGWTAPGEWFNLTVDVAQAGDYVADLLYTSNRGGVISIDVNGRPATGRCLF